MCYRLPMSSDWQAIIPSWKNYGAQYRTGLLKRISGVCYIFIFMAVFMSMWIAKLEKYRY